jgi:hypothetical protein
LLTGGILGAAIGLFYSWVISPVKYVDAPPYALRADFKDDYRALVAAAYVYSGDLLRAEDRLAQLKDDGTAQKLAEQAQRALAGGHPDEEVQALGALVLALGNEITPIASSMAPMELETDAPPTAVITSTPLLILPSGSSNISSQIDSTQANTALTLRPTSIFLPTRTPISTPTPGAPFQLFETRLVCNPDRPDPLIQVVVQDAAEQPVAGMELVVAWEEGEDHFYTGFKPEMGLGYADFAMTPEVIYALNMADGGQAVNDLIAAECLSEDGTRYWGSWLLTFIQP